MWGFKRTGPFADVRQKLDRENNRAKDYQVKCIGVTRIIIATAIAGKERFVVMKANGFASDWNIFVDAVVFVANEQAQYVENIAFHTSMDINWEGYALLTLKQTSGD